VNRYCGEAIRPGARIAVISNDALGNFVVVTPLLRLIREELRPDQLDYFGGIRTCELQAESDLFNWSFPLHGSSAAERARVVEQRHGYDLIVNVERTDLATSFAQMISGPDTLVCGPCSDLAFCDDKRGQLWEDPDWTAPDLRSRYAFLKSPFIGEIFCRLAYLVGEVPRYKVPSQKPPFQIPPVLISTAASLPEKLWPIEKWLGILRFFAARKMDVGLVGAAPKQQSQFWKGGEGEEALIGSGLLHDLRGKMTLPQVVGALHEAKLVVTLDNGILHLAVAANTMTVGLYRYGIHRLWAPPNDNLQVITPEPEQTVSEISVEVVQEAVCRAI